MGVLEAKYAIKNLKYPDDVYLRQYSTNKHTVAATINPVLTIQRYLGSVIEANAQEYNCLHQNMIHGFADTAFHIPSYDRQPRKGNKAFFCQCGGPELVWSYCKSLSIFNTILHKINNNHATIITVGDPLLLPSADDRLVALTANR